MESRIIEEWNSIKSSPIPEVCVVLLENSIRVWGASIKGPKNTPYEGGTFIMLIYFTDNYPTTRPLFLMQTKIYHPNIDPVDGEICLNYIRDEYKPDSNVGYMISCIRYLLVEPNPYSPFNKEAALLCINNKQQFESKAREETLNHAIKAN